MAKQGVLGTYHTLEATLANPVELLCSYDFCTKAIAPAKYNSTPDQPRKRKLPLQTEDKRDDNEDDRDDRDDRDDEEEEEGPGRLSRAGGGGGGRRRGARRGRGRGRGVDLDRGRLLDLELDRLPRGPGKARLGRGRRHRGEAAPRRVGGRAGGHREGQGAAVPAVL